jgi:sugar phosphate permease
MPTYLSTVRHMNLLHANTLVGGLTVAGGLFGTLAGGALGERARGRVRGAYFYVCGLSALVAGVLGVAMFLVPSTMLMSVLLFLSVFFAFVPNGPVNTIIVNSVPAHVRASASAVSIFCIHFFGDAGSPTLIGVVADAVSLQHAVLLMPLTITLGGALWWIGRTRSQQ